MDPARERDLIRDCQGGKLESFEPLVKQHQKRMGAIAYHITRDASLAEEAAQKTFVKAWQNIGKFRGDCSFGTWLHRLCVNTACDLQRQRIRQRESPLPSDLESGTPTLPPESIPKDELSPDRASMNRELKALILEALDRLPEEQRLVIVLREMQGLDYREIARSIGCQEGTVMSRLFHARRKLRLLLEKVLS